VRTLPYLWSNLAELKPLLWIFGPLILIYVPLGMLLADLFLNRMLNGEPVTSFEAWLFRLEPEVFVDVEKLSVEARQLLRDRLIIGGVGFGLAMIPVALWARWKLLLIGQKINQLLRVEMVTNLQAMSMRFHSGSRVGDSIYRTYQDSAMVTNLMWMLVAPIWPLLAGLFGFFVAFVYDWRLPVLWVGLYVLAFAMARYYTPILRRGFREARERNSALTSRIQETLSGLKVVKAFGAEPIEQARFEEASSAAFAGAYEARTKLALMGIVIFILSAMPAMLMATVLSVFAREERPLAAGFALGFVGFATWSLGAYSNALGQIGSWSRGARRLVWLWGRTQDMAVGMERAFTQVDMRPEVQDAEDAVPVPAFRESVVFEDVHFGYDPTHPVLRGVDLEARAGTITALVGPTGSGKSTLVSLLLRLFDPDQGKIEIDGHDLRSLQIESLRENVSIALQENLLFATTIRENIRYAVPAASDEQVRHAARVACAEEFIEAQPDGYDTMLGERGARLSTGQRQRISIARAIIKDTPILVLDEPTASLDAETELQVMRNLADWGQGRAIFVVTHRLSTIRRADQIVYLREGQVIEAGSHDELMDRTAGAYRRFVDLERGTALPPGDSDPVRGAAS
jgi:ABC-type multidrug transport system fused ATPase/permease subunit